MSFTFTPIRSKPLGLYKKPDALEAARAHVSYAGSYDPDHVREALVTQHQRILQALLDAGCTVVFCFGSNIAGRHGKGAALYARAHFGAVYGQGEGMQGQSYAIPTKDSKLRPLDLQSVAAHVEKFKAYAASRPELLFHVTPIGCGYAGYQHDQIAPLFQQPSMNLLLPQEFGDAMLRLRSCEIEASDAPRAMQRHPFG